MDASGHLRVADACNHRIQVFDLRDPPAVVMMWGEAGDAAGQLHTPYGIIIDVDDTVLVCEYGNHRVQRFTRKASPWACWVATAGKPVSCCILGAWSSTRTADSTSWILKTFESSGSSSEAPARWALPPGRAIQAGLDHRFRCWQNPTNLVDRTICDEVHPASLTRLPGNAEVHS